MLKPLYFPKYLSFFKLIRANNLIILFLTQTVIKLFLIGPKSILAFDRQFIFISLSTILIAASGYIINDYYDIKIDIINKPQRVVIDRFIKRRTALFIHLALVFFGIAFGLAVGWKFGLINAIAAFGLWLYSNSLKRLPLIGNLSVSLLTATSIYILAILYRDPHNFILTFSIFSFYISLIREIIKDIEDLKGDASFGCKTMPIIWGVRKTKLFLYSQFCVLTFLLFTLNPHINNFVLFYFLVFVFFPLLTMFYKLYNADTVREFRSLSTFCKYVMISGVISIVFI